MVVVMRRLYVAAAVVLGVMVVGTVATGFVAAWTGSARFANVTLVGLMTALMGAVGFWAWSDFAKPQPNLPRRDRARLRAEQRRIRLDAEIARLEREAGLS